MVAGSFLFSRRLLLIALGVCVVLQGLSLRARRIVPAHNGVAVATTGSFQPAGWFPGEAFAQTHGVRAWGSWSGADDNAGTIEIGPFPAPRVLHLGASGYPAQSGNTLQVELAGTGRRLPLKPAAIGERWAVIDQLLPANWVGRPIRIVGRDAAKGPGGWFAVSEPIHGGRSDGNNALVESLAAWSINGLLLGVLFLASARALLNRGLLAPPWIALGAGAIVALCGYVAFWLYFANALAGVIFSWALVAASVVAAVYDRRLSVGSHRPPLQQETDARAEIFTVVQLMLAIGAFHLALLHLFPTGHDFYTLAANRFRESLPSDNLLSHELAERLFAHQPVRHLGLEWLSSDRPPLQTGWQLLTWPASKWLGLDRRVASGTSAIWFQLLWVAAAYGLLRSFRLSPRRAAGWIAAMALTGFFLQNTVYTWPKLAASAFAIGAFALLVPPLFVGRVPSPGESTNSETDRGVRAPRPPGQDVVWAAAFAGLAWLAHGGVAFSFIALIPWLIACAWRCRGRRWLAAGVVFAALVLPWIAYQKFYDPPANRLLKWHLAGQSQIDPRGTWETLRDAYAKIGWREAWSNKALNLHGQVFANWPLLVDGSAENQVERRNQEFFHTARALTWWPLLALLAVVLARRSLSELFGDLSPLAGWVALTIVVWCLLMFGPYSAAIHQGSYAVMLALFVGFSVGLERGGRGWLLVLVPLQVITLATTWAVANVAINGQPIGWPFVVAGGAALAWIVARAYAGPAPAPGPSDAHDIARDSASTGVNAPRWLASFRDWWHRPRLTWWLLLSLGLLMFLRKPHALHTPQLWAEDGSVFLNDQDQYGLGAFFLPYMGYLHALPRLIAWLAAQVLDPAWWPACYNGVAFAIWLAAIARLFTARFDLPGKPWLALAFLLVPHTGEVFFNVTNLQWVTAFVLIQQAIIRPPATRGERFTDAIVLGLVALTGPFVIAFLPLFAWRWWRTRNRDNLVALAIVLACAALQAWFVWRTGPKFSFQTQAFHFGPTFEVLARRVVLWPIAGYDRALELPAWAVRTVGGLFLGGMLVWALRPSPRRGLRAQVLAAFALIVVAGVYRTRPDTWAFDNLDFGDRYFYIPRVLLAWLLIWEFDAVPRLAANFVRLVCLAAVFMHLNHYTLPAPKDYQWGEHVEPIRRGVPANIPILPENWILEYRGRKR